MIHQAVRQLAHPYSHMGTHGTGAWLMSLIWISSNLPGQVGLLGEAMRDTLLLSPS